MAKRRARKQDKAERNAPASVDGAGKRSSQPAVTGPSGAPQPPGRPWLLVLAIVAVIVVAAGVHFSSRSTVDGQDIEEIEMDAVASRPERLRVRVVQRFPHDTSAFTQGLLWHDGHLYESTGLRGRSTLRKVHLETGEVLERRDVDRTHFAEGLARVGDRLIQLTWQEGLAHIWSVDGLQHQGTFTYDGEGWGLCFDGEHLVMSDGSARLTFRDPETFRPVRQVIVRNEGRPVRDLNELECVDGAIWANVWQREEILRIDPVSGRVTAVVDASGLLTEEERRRVDVLNGIAWIPERQRFVITGKNWPYLFEIELDPR